ncbi:MAG: hypothetical protein R2744_10670 [Bacteroidales bacterium]
MKPINLLTVITFLLLPSAAKAQYAEGMSKLYYSDSSGEKGVTTYIFNGKNLPYKAIWELEDGTRWSENYHRFDTAGHLVERTRYFSDSLKTYQSFTYNISGMLIHETFSRSDGIEGLTDYNYENNRCTMAVCKSHNGWFTGIIRYIYDSTGTRTGATMERDGTVIGGISYKSDDRGRILEERWSFSNGFTQDYLYDYLDDGCTIYRSSNVFIVPSCRWRIREENYDYSGQGGGPSYYIYGERGSLDHKTFVRSDGLKTETEFYYQDNGLLEKSIRKYSDGSTGTFRYNYDCNGKLVERNFLRSDGTEASEKYVYDINGRLINGEYFNFDGWLTGKLTFYHDRYDRIISARFKGEDGFSAEIEFSYNGDGNLETIKWHFSNGDTQTYFFKYEMLPANPV